MALEGDLNTIAGFTVTEQGETPGLGSKITDLTWLSKWPGKALLDEAGALKIAVVRGQAQTDYEIDGITGADADWQRRQCDDAILVWPERLLALSLTH